jgi:hypothetical protein
MHHNTIRLNTRKRLTRQMVRWTVPKTRDKGRLEPVAGAAKLRLPVAGLFFEPNAPGSRCRNWAMSTRMTATTAPMTAIVHRHP